MVEIYLWFSVRVGIEFSVRYYREEGFFIKEELFRFLLCDGAEKGRLEVESNLVDMEFVSVLELLEINFCFINFLV